jgi:hypothetical protein
VVGDMEAFTREHRPPWQLLGNGERTDRIWLRGGCGCLCVGPRSRDIIPARTLVTPGADAK